jgi:hypothetical protein
MLGVGLGAVGEVVGGYVGLSADVSAGHEAGAGLSLGAALGAILAVGPAVWLGGRAMGGDGAFGWTLLGGAIGTGLSAATLAIKDNVGTLVLAAAWPVVGAIVGFELSSNGASDAVVAVAPTVSPGAFGLAGRF